MLQTICQIRYLACAGLFVLILAPLRVPATTPAVKPRVPESQIQLDVVVARGRSGVVRTFAGHLMKESMEVAPCGKGKSQGFTGILDCPRDTEIILAFLHTLRTEGVIKLLAEPRLSTMSGRQASFMSGGLRAAPMPAGSGSIGVQFEESGPRLDFLPTVMSHGKIHLRVEYEVLSQRLSERQASFLDGGERAVPVPAGLGSVGVQFEEFGTRHDMKVKPEASSSSADNGTSVKDPTVPVYFSQRLPVSVELEVGQTFVIGGLIQHEVSISTVKVPILGDVPFIGAAFGNKIVSDTELEMLILVTPQEVLPGQETHSSKEFELFLDSILEQLHSKPESPHGKSHVPAR